MSCTCHTNEQCETENNLSSCFALVNKENIAHCPFPGEVMKVYTKESDEWKIQMKTADQLSDLLCPSHIPYRGTPRNYPNYCFSTKKCSEEYAIGCNYVYKPKAYMLVHKPCMDMDVQCAKVPKGFALTCNGGSVQTVDSELIRCPDGETPVTCQSSPQELSVATTMCERDEDCTCDTATWTCKT